MNPSIQTPSTGSSGSGAPQDFADRLRHNVLRTRHSRTTPQTDSRKAA